VGPVLAPPGWPAQVQKLLGPGIKAVGKGDLKVEGNAVSVRGEVASDAARAQAGSELAAAMAPGYTLRTELRVAAGQRMLDAVLAQRIIEFDSGQATLRPSGMAILDEMAAVILKLKGAKIEVSGHTDNVGQRTANIALSQARAQAVRAYLALKGVDPDTVAVSGVGPDRPVADNASSEGRARNRRIEFKVAG
jgi:OmpA-OmpF porin, OOP family